MSRLYPLTTLALLVAGAFLVVTTFAFGGGAADWIAFGVSAGTLAGGATAAIAAPSRSGRALNAGVALLSAWTILVALGIFSGAVQTWLIFAAGAAIAGAATIAQAAYDVGRARAEASGPVAVPAVKAA
jgi:hypothetical protein